MWGRGPSAATGTTRLVVWHVLRRCVVSMGTAVIVRMTDAQQTNKQTPDKCRTVRRASATARACHCYVVVVVARKIRRLAR